MNVNDSLVYLVARTNRQLEQSLAQMIRNDGVTIEVMRILDAVTESAGMAMGPLALRVLVDAPTLTKIIDRMVSDGLVYRTPDLGDRRRVIVVATDKGQTLQQKLQSITADKEELLVQALGGNEARRLKQLLKVLLELD